MTVHQDQDPVNPISCYVGLAEVKGWGIPSPNLANLHLNKAHQSLLQAHPEGQERGPQVTAAHSSEASHFWSRRDRESE